MLKLYRIRDEKKQYWETWEDDDGKHIVHFGDLGTRGSSRTVSSGLFRKATSVIQKEIDALVRDGFGPIAEEDHVALLIEYAVDGFGTPSDLAKRHRLEERMDETLGWTGLGACDGGSIGSGTMEVCNFVVDFELAKEVISAELAGTEFADYTRIYREDSADEAS